MAKRFTDTDLFKKSFFRKLEPQWKLFWIYLFHECNHAGIWEVDFEVAELRCGPAIIEDLALKLFKDRIKVLDNGEKWFIPKFIEFQYGELNPNNRAHASVISVLKRQGAWKGLTSPSQGAKDKDKEQDKDKAKAKDKDKEKKYAFGESGLVNLTVDEYTRLTTYYGKSTAREYIGRCNDHIGKTGKDIYKSHYHAIKTWLRKDGKSPKNIPYPEHVSKDILIKKKCEDCKELFETTVVATTKKCSKCSQKGGYHPE